MKFCGRKVVGYLKFNDIHENANLTEKQHKQGTQALTNHHSKLWNAVHTTTKLPCRTTAGKGQ